ncbi:MAG: hypothetical protein JXA09_08765 [Anaerolineae bacterium]|nr:hypothetical protein [Anaerolineae bacterium]
MRISTGWVVISILLGFVLFSVLVLPGESAKAEAVAGQAGTPDLSLIYTPEDLYRMAEAYGAEGRAAYVRARWTFDLVFPLVYTAFLVTAISWLYSSAFAEGSLWRRANLVPLLGMALDYLENASTSLVTARYPDRMRVVATVAPLFTATKWLFVGGSSVLLVVGVVLALVAWRRRASARQ